MTVTMSSLPRWNGVRVADDGPVGENMSRRGFLARVAGVGALTVGLHVLDVLGGTTPANAGRTCSTSGLTYRKTCGYNYSGTSCSDGCPRSAGVDNGTFCRYSGYGSRHRTCGESRTVSGVFYEYRIRTNECYGGGYDGWRWSSSKKCGCPKKRKFSCNDGYYRHHVGTSWSKSICQRKKCV